MAVMAGLSPGAVFAGYRIDALVGRGGMGVIFRATESRPQRTVALKVVAPEWAADADFRVRFLRESQIAASIEHPHVVPVSRVGEEGGMLFIAMRFIQGRDLAALIAEEGRLDPLRAARVVDQIADALDTAHEQGLVHRDVKPANVLVEHRRRGEHVYLTDFGLTKSLTTNGRLTGTGMVVGTTDYMAPEQFEGGRLDARADVYSLGCMLFELLTGRVPFVREGQAARMYAHLTAPPPTVSDLVPGVSPKFDQIIGRALAKSPDDRYPSAGDLGSAALAAAEGRSVSRPERRVAVGQAAPTEVPGPTAAAPKSIEVPPTGPRHVPVARAPESPTAEPDPIVAEAAASTRGAIAAGGVSAAPTVTPRERSAKRATWPRPVRETPPAGLEGRRLMPAAAAVAIAAAVAVIAVVVLAGGSAATARTARGGPLTVSYRSPWHAASGSVPIAFAFSRGVGTRAPGAGPVSLSSAGVTLTAGTLVRSAVVPGGPPPQIVGRDGHPSGAGAALVAGNPGRRYAWTLTGGHRLVAFVLPTASADLAIVCEAPSSADAALRSCSAMATSARVSGAQLLAPGFDQPLASALRADLSPVASARTRLGGLTGDPFSKRAPQAEHLALVEAGASSSIAKVATPPRYRPLTAALISALRREAAAFTSLASAARRSDRQAYETSTGTAMAAARSLASAADALRAAQLPIPVLGVLKLAGLPPVATNAGSAGSPPTYTGSRDSTPTGGSPSGASTSTGTGGTPGSVG